MKPALLALALSSLLALPAMAQTGSKPAFPPAPPPPGLNDPGVKASAEPAKPAEAASSSPAEVAPTRLGGAPVINDPSSARDEGLPQVSVHQDGDNTVQEFRRNGRLYMVVVTPKNGVPQTYNVDANGKWRDDQGAPPVQPVMYKILEWGKAPPPPDADGN